MVKPEYYELKRYGDAIADYTRAIELNQEHSIAWNNRANCYATMGKKVEATRDLEMAVRINPPQRPLAERMAQYYGLPVRF